MPAASFPQPLFGNELRAVILAQCIKGEPAAIDRATCEDWMADAACHEATVDFFTTHADDSRYPQRVVSLALFMLGRFALYEHPDRTSDKTDDGGGDGERMSSDNTDDGGGGGDGVDGERMSGDNTDDGSGGGDSVDGERVSDNTDDGSALELLQRSASLGCAYAYVELADHAIGDYRRTMDLLVAGTQCSPDRGFGKGRALIRLGVYIRDNCNDVAHPSTDIADLHPSTDIADLADTMLLQAGELGFGEAHMLLGIDAMRSTQDDVAKKHFWRATQLGYAPGAAMLVWFQLYGYMPADAREAHRTAEFAASLGSGFGFCTLARFHSTPNLPPHLDFALACKCAFRALELKSPFISDWICENPSAAEGVELVRAKRELARVEAQIVTRRYIMRLASVGHLPLLNSLIASVFCEEEEEEPQ